MLSGNDAMIHVSNLPGNASKEFLRKFFSSCGTILHISTIKRSKDNRFALIEFENKESALEAVRRYNYVKIDNESIVITYASIENMRIIYSGLGNIFISGIPEDVEASQLHKFFEQFGEVISCRMPVSKGKNYGYAYIQFKNPNDAETAKIQMQNATINGKPVRCELYVKKDNIERPEFVDRKAQLDKIFTNLFVQNLPDSVQTLADLVALFMKFGTIQSARLIPEKNVAFINMADHDSAQRAISISGTLFGGKRLIVTRALMKEERLAFHQH